MVLCADALEVMQGLPDASVDLVLVDPPYYRVKGEAWDRQWEKPADFLAWLGVIADEWARVLKPNGSLYCFASPQMAARVEVMLAERFHVLNRIRWVKAQGWHHKAHKEDLRGYLSPWEEIIFAEHYGADSMALGESGYAAQCEQLRGFVFESLRAYLDGERRRAGINFDQVRGAVGCRPKSGLPSHWFTQSQWMLPTQQHYAALQRLFNERGRRPAPPFTEYHPPNSPFARFHQTRQTIEYLRTDYEELRRPFSVTADVPYTDVWDFATVPAYNGKHPCQKPLELLSHVIRISTRPTQLHSNSSSLVLDCFCGTGSALVAAAAMGRHYLGIEREARYVEAARAALQRVQCGEDAYSVMGERRQQQQPMKPATQRMPQPAQRARRQPAPATITQPRLFLVG